ncbi:hypothetical protein EU805_16960 [Salipiger sp. IMCC34102]|uniref:AAA family ATPase n=1 Tax=Salipiger sp. IMCC34102 TaxID=2510647 RepID=UPI00101C86E0|nr:AAA family ATPase [Salipiger sp. IMCC34102]RYH00737.1 hypothetical protein EU805_16960 [Salipiger sp. IMCC34102]
MKKPCEQLLLISGPVGVGKTSVAGAVSSLLQEENVPHTFIDLDALTYTYPRIETDPFNSSLALEILTAMWANCRKRGSKNLVIARVIEKRSDAEAIADAVNIYNPVLCRLTASASTLKERIRMRKAGSNISWQENRSIQLSTAMEKSKIEDFCISTQDRSITDIVMEINQFMTWSR